MSVDRLSSLFRHVQFQVSPVLNLKIPRLRVLEEEAGIRVSFCKSAVVDHRQGCDISLDFGSNGSPFLLALPDELHVVFSVNDSAYPVAALIVQETTHKRCGSPAVLDRLFEVLLILLLRRAIEEGQQTTGLLAGLSDNYIKHALVAVHEKPGSDWSTDRLAELSGLSRTAFYQRFNRCIGTSPMHYVRNWRLSLANIQLNAGERISQVAFSLGYRSVEGFSRAFHQRFGIWPGEAQRQEHVESA